MDFIWFIIIGLLAGFIAGQLMKGRGFGFWGNLIVGLVGGVLGGFVLRLLGLKSVSLVGKLATSVGGAVLLLLLVGLIKKK
jgi:uncharacterized membrane protein YeaQ/YmgE (transglycosylase-associated protein family)